MTGVLIRRENLDTETDIHTHTRKMMYEDKGRNQGKVTRSQRMPEIISKLPEPKTSMKQILSQSLRKEPTLTTTLDLRLTVPRTMI